MGVRRWLIIMLLTGLVVSTVLVAVSAQTPRPVGAATIISPRGNSTVGSNESVSGRAQLPSGYTLWVMPYDGLAGKYYPQLGQVVIRDASWSIRLSFDSIPIGQKFQIRAVSADTNANNQLNNYVRSGQKGGMTTLPAGAQAIEAITVTRGTSSNATSTSTASASPSMIPIVTQNVSKTTTSTSNVVQASASASSQSLLPGFEAIYALGALAIAFVLVFKGRLLK